MEGSHLMSCEEKESKVYVYSIQNRTITIPKDIVDKFSKTVCPVTEKYLSGGIKLFGKDSNGIVWSDDVLSSLIVTDMVKDIDVMARSVLSKNDELYAKLNAIPDSYYGFVEGIISYAKKKPERIDKVLRFIDSTSNPTSSDVVKFVMEQPDFHEYGLPRRDNHGHV